MASEKRSAASAHAVADGGRPAAENVAAFTSVTIGSQQCDKMCKILIMPHNSLAHAFAEMRTRVLGSSAIAEQATGMNASVTGHASPATS
jgi:hypothetical protein